MTVRIPDDVMQEFCLAVYGSGGSQLDYAAARRALAAVAPRLLCAVVQDAFAAAPPTTPPRTNLQESQRHDPS